ncbi:IucA/IucC family protein [Halanaeroarchaeum sulfurireducens]|nr:IucA/IucC family protein [Halanaeroarchaeum sulfurireducens]
MMRPRTTPEWNAFGAATRYAQTHDLSEPAEAAYLEALDEARRDILRRLVRGVIRGDPTGLPSPELVPPVRARIADAIPDVDDVEIPWEVTRAETYGSVAVLPLPPTNKTLLGPIKTTHGFDRHRIGDDSWLVGHTRVDRIDHPVSLLDLLDRAGAFVDDGQAARFRVEVAESVANLALARLADAVLGERLDPSSPVLRRVANGNAAADRPAALERIVTDGHPFHPAGKIRKGMSAADGLAYAPEFTDRIDLRFVAIDSTVARETRSRGRKRLTDRLFETFGGLEEAASDELPPDRPIDRFAVVPVHPWQFHHTILDRYEADRRTGRVVPLSYTHPATPLLNLRTVVPHDTDRLSDDPPHIKLAIDVQTTNVVRTLSPNAVTNGPQVTDALEAIASRESFDHLGFLPETAATCYYQPGGPHTEGHHFDDARHLSGMVRMNPAHHPFVGTDAVAVPAASLIASVPGTDRPLVCDLVSEYTATDGDGPDPRSFFEAYVDVVVPEQLLLLSKYGIALESHLQNAVVVFDEARPVAALIRDFGGVRVLDDRLAPHGLDVSVDPYPNSDIDADGEKDLYGKLYYALFQNHLAELLATLAHECDMDEAAGWDAVAHTARGTFDAIRAAHDVPADRVNRDEAALFEPSMQHKALTAMRLRGKRHEYVTSRVSNPLAREDR